MTQSLTHPLSSPDTAIKGICFDLFHTLVDVGQVPLEVGRFTADILGLDRNDWNEACFSQAHDICCPTDHVDTVRRLAHHLNPSIPEPLIRQAAEERQRRFDHALIHVEAALLQQLEQIKDRGYRLALVSNASSGEVRAWDESPLAALFDTAVFSCHCGYRKPEAGIYQQALQHLQLSAEECLFVGDGGSDEHRGAAAQGMHPLMITRYIGKDSDKARRRRPHVKGEIEKVEELLALLDG